jgi:hypothetical protein
MRILAAAGIIATAVGLTAFAGFAAPHSQNQATTSGPQAQGPGVTPGSVLGAVDALGQEVKRPAAPTSAPPRLPDGTIDLGDGIWITVPLTPESGLRGAEELLLPPAKALMASRQRTDDPIAWCLPTGVMRYSPYPFRFIQNYTHKKPTHLYILYETMRTFRQVFVDGRNHPPEPDPTWFGHSVGRYETDTLVIDTVGLNDKFWFDNRGMPHSEQMHTIERWTRIDAGHLATEVLIEDPATFSRPFTVRFQSRLAQPGDELMEYICQENNQYGIASGVR